jgi:hypothetical protein
MRSGVLQNIKEITDLNYSYDEYGCSDINEVIVEPIIKPWKTPFRMNPIIE